MLLNKSKNSLVAKDFLILTGVEKLIGLIGQKEPKTVIFKTHFGIHTFFLKFPIDLIIVSKEKKVVFIKQSVKPNKIVFWNFKYSTVIELPEGSIEKSNIAKGNILEF